MIIKRVNLHQYICRCRLLMPRQPRFGVEAPTDRDATTFAKIRQEELGLRIVGLYLH